MDLDDSTESVPERSRDFWRLQQKLLEFFEERGILCAEAVQLMTITVIQQQQSTEEFSHWMSYSKIIWEEQKLICDDSILGENGFRRYRGKGLKERDDYGFR